MTPPPFTADDAERAHAVWGANCGPGSLAAIMGMTLDDVRPHLLGFDAKRYTTPSMMNDALRSIGRPWKKIGAAWPGYGLVRVQWEGPWTDPGVPMVARYRYTHWIGAEPSAFSISTVLPMVPAGAPSRIGLRRLFLGFLRVIRAQPANGTLPTLSKSERGNEVYNSLQFLGWSNLDVVCWTIYCFSLHATFVLRKRCPPLQSPFTLPFAYGLPNIQRKSVMKLR